MKTSGSPNLAMTQALCSIAFGNKGDHHCAYKRATQLFSVDPNSHRRKELRKNVRAWCWHLPTSELDRKTQRASCFGNESADFTPPLATRWKTVLVHWQRCACKKTTTTKAFPNQHIRHARDHRYDGK